MDYVAYYGKRLQQDRFGEHAWWHTIAQVFNPVSAVKTVSKYGPSVYTTRLKEEVSEAGPGMLNPVKGAAEREAEDKQRRVQQKQVREEAKKQAIAKAVADHKAETDKLLSDDGIPAHLRDKKDKNWTTYATYAVGGIVSIGVLYYGRRYFIKRKQVTQ
tara:strand:+ start:68 stop:544 length:477 start_codon:yes stop_codon:yes gene_type:complete